MRRAVYMLFILFFLASTACRALLPAADTLPAKPSPTTSPSPTAPFTPAPTSTAPPPATSLPPQPVTPEATEDAGDDPQGFSVTYHPDGGLFVGDLVSFEVIAPPGNEELKLSVRIELEGDSIRQVAQGDFASFGIGQRYQASLIWAWDTQGLNPGDYRLRYNVQPLNVTWHETVTLQPAEDRTLAEQQAAWATATSACCAVHYMTGSAAARDLPQLLPEIDAQARSAEEKLGISFSEPITITLLPRLLGHGGFASSEIHVSYLDRDYAAGDAAIVIHHEMVHILDARLGGEMRPTMLVEGLAVYLSGGHFKPEPLMARAAALLDSSSGGASPLPAQASFIPLAQLADDFYHSQHEIGYLEGGALIEYMVEEWGWEAFSSFYRDIKPHPSGSQAQAIDVALQEHFELTLADLEVGFVAALRRLGTTAELRQDVQLTVAFFDTVRRYQQDLDPSAYFMTAWLLDTQVMRQRGIVADYARHLRQAENLVLETLLVSAADRMVRGDFPGATQRLEAVNAVLQATEDGSPSPLRVDPMAAEYEAIVTVLQNDPRLAIDYEVQRVELSQSSEGKASAWVGDAQANLFEVTLVKTPQGWQVETIPVGEK